jgi:Tfp pilus assembly protein PilV
MTLVEILVASVIMFIILTAVLGLVAQTTAMAVQAKRKTMLTNAVSAYVEHVQGLPFAQVGVISVNASGTLDAAYVEDEGDFTITIRPTVLPGANADLKTLRLNVTLADTGGASQTLNTDVAIRNRSQYLLQSNRNPATDPAVRFIAPTPAEGTVVFDNTWNEGGTLRSLTLGLFAEASTGRTIQSAKVWCDDTWLLKDSFGNLAQWPIDMRTWNLSSFRWNTRQAELVDGVDTEVIPDGMRTISLYALDSAGVSVFSVRHLLVDNRAPWPPGTPVPTVKTATATDLAWEQAMDGTTPADRYGLWISRVKTPAEYAANNSSALISVLSAEMPQPSYALTTTAFTRYRAQVRAYSPRNLESSLVEVAEHFTSRPLLSGTYAVTERKDKGSKYYKTTVNLSVTPPNCATHAQPQYTWYWRYSDGTTGTATTSVATYQLVTVETLSVARPVRVWVEIAYRPVDRLSTLDALTVRSNTAGPTPVTGSGTLAQGTW